MATCEAPSNETLPVTAIVSTKNEALAIANCVKSLERFDQVYVVDSMSTDGTAALATQAGADVVNFEWNGRYPKKKQWCLENLSIRNDWVLFIDADERPSPALIDELARIVRINGQVNAYDIPLDYYFAGRRLRHGHTVLKRSLIKPKHCHFPVFDDLDAPGMGELEGHYQPVVVGPIGRTTSTILHNDPDPISTWVARHNKYSDWEAYLRRNPELLRSIRAARSSQGRFFDRFPGKPAIFFLYSFVLRRGFLDGRAGFDYAVGLAWYYWLVGLKVRELHRTPEDDVQRSTTCG